MTNTGTKTSRPQEHGQGKVFAMCSYNCKGWPNEKCRVSSYFQNPEIWRKKKLWFWFQTPRCSDHRQRRQLGKLSCPFQAGHQGWQLSKVSEVFFMSSSSRLTCCVWFVYLLNKYNQKKSLIKRSTREVEDKSPKYVKTRFRCANIPRGCQRCDDVCAKKDGKRSKNGYHG